MDTVIVKLRGGLGNQMFQYACGRRLAFANTAQLKLDISDLGVNSGRMYGLSHLNISGDIASRADIERFRKSSLIRSGFFRIGLNAKPYRERNIVRERFFHFDESILGLQGDAYLDGYWQSERYFSDIKHIVLREFTIREQPDLSNERIGKEILESNSVSLHVRRGDYVSNPEINRVHGVCSLDYYHEAVRQIADRVKEPHFFIFSDDPTWVKTNLLLDHQVTFVTHDPEGKSYEDLRLMSLSKHHIIANSSFSWWGAWLGGNPGKVVIAPNRWFNDFSADTKDLIPSSWLRI